MRDIGDNWRISLITWHCFAIITNIFHMVVLFKMPSLKKPNGKIIILVAVFDVILSFLIIIDNTQLSSVIEYRDDISKIFGNGVYEAVGLTSVQMTYYVCAFGTYERCIALCYPYRHLSDKIVRNVGKAILITAILLLSFHYGMYVGKTVYKQSNKQSNIRLSSASLESINSSVTNEDDLNSNASGNDPSPLHAKHMFETNRKDMADNSELTRLPELKQEPDRISTLSERSEDYDSSLINKERSGGRDIPPRGGASDVRGGHRSSPPKDPKEYFPYYTEQLIFRYQVQLLPAVLIMLVTVPLTVRELVLMGRSGGEVNRSADPNIRMATIYIIVICSISLVTLLPQLVMSMIPTRLPDAAVMTFKCLHDGYCVLNILIYGAMNKQYREKVCAMVTQKTGPSAVGAII
mgnify:CR=1 FL=1